MTQVNATDVRSNAMTWVDAHEPCDTTQVATTHIHVSTGVTHTHTHTHTTPCPARMHCSPPPTGPETTFKITFTVIADTRDAAQPFLDDQKGSRQHGGRADWHTRSGCTRAVRPHGAAIAAGGPGSCTAFPCLRLRPFPTRSRLLSLCAHFPCATMSARVQDVERRNGLSTLGHYDGDATMRL